MTLPPIMNSVRTFTNALEILSAAYFPLQLDFSLYRSRFSLLSRDEILHDGLPRNNPFYDYYTSDLLPRIASEAPGLVGISVAFPGQIQPAYSLAYLLRMNMPEVHVTVGGPAITQFLQRLNGAELEAAMEPFHTAVAGEGEYALLGIIERLADRKSSSVLNRGNGFVPPSGIITGKKDTDLSLLPAPDFDGLPLESYFSPEPVLPYDAARGCYWGRCAFCHYGLAECGTLPYRERPVETVAGHLDELSRKYGARLFYLSEDTISPKTLLKLSRSLKASGSKIRWSTDLRAEPSLTRETCSELKEGGALSVSLGIESGSERILSLIEKGIRPVNGKKCA